MTTNSLHTTLLSLIQLINGNFGGQLIYSREHVLSLFVYNMGWNLLPARLREAELYIIC